MALRNQLKLINLLTASDLVLVLLPNNGSMYLPGPLVLRDSINSSLINNEQLDKVLDGGNGLSISKGICFNAPVDGLSPLLERHVLQKSTQVERQVHTVNSFTMKLRIKVSRPLDEESKQLVRGWVLVEVFELLEAKVPLAVALAELKEHLDLITAKLNTIGKEHAMELMDVDVS